MQANERKLFLDIDVKKIKEAIRDAHKTGYANGDIFNNHYMSWKQYTTLLYSIRAHSRGKLHITKRWVSNRDAEGTERLVEYNLEDQAKMIGNAWEAFKWVPPAIDIHQSA